MESNLLTAAWAQLWQVTLLVVVVALLVRTVARNRPHLAHALWLVVLVKCVMPPVWSSPSGVFCWLQPSQGATVSRLSVEIGTHDRQSLNASGAIALPAAGATEPVSSKQMATIEAHGELNWPRRLLYCGLMTWALGAAFSLIVSSWQWQQCYRAAHRHGSVPSGELAELVSTLARRLGLRKPPRVIVTQGKLGPAVTGILRPTLLLPEGILGNEDTQNTEPILAHELIHIRRGDLWAGVLQTIVLALWWFHPLVRRAVRQAMCEAERCCDEAVLAELDCEPKQYARGLLDVLQYKTNWAPVPAFPGAGRVDATATRLERIMRLGQGCRRRSPWWWWLVMAAVAVVVLPGGAFFVSGDEPNDQLPLATVAGSLDATVGGNESEPAPQFAPPSSEVVHVYSVGDILTETCKRYDIDPMCVKDRLFQRIEMIASTPGQQSDKLTPTIAWSGNQMVVRASEQQQREVVETLETIRRYGLSKLIIHVSFATIASDVFDSLNIGWTVMPGGVDSPGDPMDAMHQYIVPNELVHDPRMDAMDQRVVTNDAQLIHVPRPENNFPRPSSEKAPATQGYAQHVVSKHLPMRHAVLNEEDAGAVVECVQGNRWSNIMQAPRVTLFNGQSAFVSDCSQSSFVVGVKPVVGPYATANEPVVRVIQEGTRVQVRPILCQDDSLTLDYELAFASIHDVDVVKIDRETSVQVPTVESMRIQATSELSLGSTLVIAGPEKRRRQHQAEESSGSILTRLAKGVFGGKSNGENEKVSLLVLIRVENVFTNDAANQPATKQVGMVSR